MLELLKLAVTLKLGITSPTGMPFTACNTPFAIVTNILLLQALDLHDTTTLNYAAWSISAEFWSYEQQVTLTDPDPRLLRFRFDLSETAEIDQEARYNVAPTDGVLAVRRNRDGQREPGRWPSSQE